MSRRAHKPTDDSRTEVETLAGYGIQQDAIALYLGIDKKTLLKHYRKELDVGIVKTDVNVTKCLMEQIREGNTAATIFYLKARCGWRETQRTEVSIEPFDDAREELIRRLTDQARRAGNAPGAGETE